MQKTAILFLLLFAGILSGIEPGGMLSIGELREKAEALTHDPVPAQTPGYEIIVFFDTNARDTMSYMQMLNDLCTRMSEYPSAEQANVYALARNSKRETEDLLKRFNPAFAIGRDKDRILFAEYATGELFLPFALIAKEGKVLWKGSPLDLENIMNLIRKKKFDPTLQLKISRIRKEMQMAVQASLPDVIQRCADEILKLQPGDTLAIQAKLFVYENSGRFPAALSFTKRNALANPDDVNHTLLYLNYLYRAGNPAPFPAAFADAVKQFSKSPESLFRLLAFAVNGTVPFSWLPPKEIKGLPDMIRQSWAKKSAGRRGVFAEYEAAVCYGLCDIAGAVKAQEEALRLCEAARQKEVRRQLEFYRSIQQMKK